MKKYILLISIVVAIIAVWLYRKHNRSVEVKSEKVLVIANDSKLQGLDPIHIDDVFTTREIAKVYEGLLEFHYLKRPFELSPNLAAAMPTVSEDQLVYTFKIRQGVMFQNDRCFPNNKGRELIAEDFVYAFKRLADPKQQAKGFWIIDNKIKGLNAWRQKYADATAADYQETIEGIKSLDRYTLQITLTSPFSQFLYALTLPPCFVVAHEAVSHYGEEFMNHPVGTGPFVLEKFSTQDSKLIYRKNPTFRDKFFPTEAADEYKHMLVYAEQKLPLVDQVIVYILPEVQPRWLQFQGGHIDVINLSSDKLGSEVVKDNKISPALQEKGVNLFCVPQLATSYTVFNMVHPLFKDNLKLRQAMSLAFDGEGYNRLFYDSTAILAQSTIPPGLAGYQAGYKNPYLTHDLTKAREYLAAAGYTDGKGLPEITLDVSSRTDSKLKGEFFQSCMAKIGIRIKIIENLFPVLMNKLVTKSTMLHSMSWTADYPDAENFLQLFYGPVQPGSIGSNMNDPSFNSLYATVSKLPDSPARTKLYEQINQLVAAYVPAVYTVHAPHISLYYSWVKNYCWSNCHFGTEQYWDIDVAQRQAAAKK